MSRNSLAAFAAMIVVAAAVAMGMWTLGTPSRERQIHQDIRTVQAIRTLALDIDSRWHAAKKMPLNLETIPLQSAQDPTTHAPFVYHVKADAEYELCAMFLTSDLHDKQSETPFWRHGKGLSCFELDASQEPPPAPLFNFY